MLNTLQSESEKAPSPESAPPAGASLSTEPAPESEEPTSNGHWWSRFLQTRGHHAADEEVSPPDEQAAEQPSIAPKTVTLTEEELAQRVARQAQSLHDRETARRNRENADAERRRQRDENPWQYVQDEKEREDLEKARQQQTQELMTLLGHVGRQHDAVSIDPIVNALPAKERERILAMPDAGQGLPGRKVIVDEALKTYGRLEYDRGYREAQAKLKKDPAFRKSVLSELRGAYEEPELYPGNGSPQEGLGEDNVSTILRRNYLNR